jgi:putative DNA primase/helicase
VFADHLRSACALYYGTACREFIAAIAPEPDETAASAKGIAQQFVDDNCPGDCDGQVKRVAARFGLIAAAGEIATALEILPWPEAEATRAVRECFAAWVDVRGGIETAEEREGVAAVRAFLSAHALSRFLPAWESDDPAAAKIVNLAGYRRRASADMDAWDFYITMHGPRSPLASTKRPWPKHSQKMASSKSPRNARIAPKWSVFQA